MHCVDITRFIFKNCEALCNICFRRSFYFTVFDFILTSFIRQRKVNMRPKHKTTTEQIIQNSHCMQWQCVYSVYAVWLHTVLILYDDNDIPRRCLCCCWWHALIDLLNLLPGNSPMKPFWDYAIADHRSELGLCEPAVSTMWCLWRLTLVHHLFFVWNISRKTPKCDIFILLWLMLDAIAALGWWIHLLKY